MRAVAILTGPATHLDHLGVLSVLLDIPLIVTEESVERLAKAYYPQITTHRHEMSELSLEYLAREYDAIFESGKFWTIALKPFIELLYKKQIRFVFCPHGNSDKGHSSQNEVAQDLSLVYGDHLHDHLKKIGAREKIGDVIYTGNYRLPFYLAHRPFYDALVEREVLSHFSEKKPMILYAPTWQDRENPTSFFTATDTLIEQLSDDYNLVIKLHPFLLEDHLGFVLHTLQQYLDHPSVLFLNDFPPIYPLLARCDLYLGDFSSIGYDFLAFDRPLYFFNSSPHSPLSRCGITFSKKEKKHLKAVLAETWADSQASFSSVRQKTYAYAFGKERTPIELRQEIFETLRRPYYSSVGSNIN